MNMFKDMTLTVECIITAYINVRLLKFACVQEISSSEPTIDYASFLSPSCDRERKEVKSTVVSNDAEIFSGTSDPIYNRFMSTEKIHVST